MSKTENIRLFTEILNMCQYENQDANVRKKLQLTISSLLKTAQERCVSHMLQLKQNNLLTMPKDELKKEARILMHSQLEILINSPEFLETCRNIINCKNNIIDNLSNVKNQIQTISISDDKSQIKSNSLSDDKCILIPKNSKTPNIIPSAEKKYIQNKEKPKKKTLKKKPNVEVPQRTASNGQNENTTKSKQMQRSQSKENTQDKKSYNKSQLLNENSKVIQHKSIQKLNTIQQGQLKPIYTAITAAINSKNSYNKTPPRTSSYTSFNSSKRSGTNTPLMENNSNLATGRKSVNMSRTESLLTIKSGKNQSPKNVTTRVSKESTNSRKPLVPVPHEILVSLHGSDIIRFQKIRDYVETAIRAKKVFMICGYGTPRRFLISRGWVEKITLARNYSEAQQTADKMSVLQLFNAIDDRTHGYLYNRMLKSKLLGNNACDLIWDPKPINYSLLKTVKKPVFVNHFRKRGQYDFCSKIGLCRHMRNLKWNYRKGVADVYFPRTYILTDNEMEEFVYDFRITACMALLKWTVNRSRIRKPVVTKDGKVPIDAFFFAILQCIGYIKHCKDCDFRLMYSLQTWNNFIDHYYQCVYKNECFYSSDDDNIADMIAQATEILARVRIHRPELNYEGNYNVWILKPDSHSRGQGIHVCRRLCQIKELVNKNVHLRYLVQKYIEKPLIIYNTKFDIRQWFLISSSSPLTVWIYEECYLRFSSQQYDLTKFHESIHLTNNSVQCRYKNTTGRDPNLPHDNMWDSNRFDTYLKSIGHPEAWKTIIYPKMKEAIMAVVLSAKDEMEKREYSFELYGADFMLTSDFQPWLIEVNSHPAMCPSTSVTARMCPQVIEDVIKVVIDGHRSPTCSKGKFELIYKEKLISYPKQSSENLYVYGTPLSVKYYNLIDEAIKARTSLIVKKSESEYLSLEDNTTSKNAAFYKNNYTLESLPNIVEKNELITMSSIQNNSGDPIQRVNDDKIEITRKIVHMRSILTYLMKLLNRERLKRSVEDKSNGKQIKEQTISSQITPIISEQDIESTIEDIQKTIDSLMKGKLLPKNSETGKHHENGVLSNKTSLLPRTLTNIITILTVGLYEKNQSCFIPS